MDSISSVVQDIEEAITCLNSVINDLLPDLAVLDDNESSTESMIEFLKKRVSELEKIKTDVVTNHDVAEAKRAVLNL